MWEQPTYPAAVCPHNSSLFLSPVSAVHTEPRTALYHSTSPFSLSTYYTAPYTETNNELL